MLYSFLPANAVRSAKISNISIPSHQAMQAGPSKRLQLLGYMKINHFKMPLNLFSTTFTCSNCTVYRLFYF